MKSFAIFGVGLLFLSTFDVSSGSTSVSLDTNPNVIHLNDMFWEVQYLMFENVHLRDLISLAQTSQHFSFLSQEIFKRKHSNKLFRLYRPQKSTERSLLDLTDMIIAQNYDTILKIFKIFGHLIKRIELLCATSHEEDMTEFIAVMNLHCADTLIELDIESHHPHFFDGMAKPFQKLEVLSMRGKVESLRSNALNFNELFPVVRRLKLGDYLEIFNKSCIDVKFEHLEYLYVSISYYGLQDELNANDVEKFLRKNSHIRTLLLLNAKRPLIKLTSEILPNIPNLELISHQNTIEDGDREIVFKDVTNLTISRLDEERYRNITFPNLTEVHTEVDVLGGTSKLVRFVRINPHLKKVFLDWGFIHHGSIQELSEAKFNIEEITFHPINVSENEMIDFIRNNEQMKRIMVTRYVEDTNIDILRDHLEDKWIITTCEKTVIFTQRD